MINICPNCKGIIGSEKICPKCGANTINPVEISDNKDGGVKEASSLTNMLNDDYYSHIIKGNKVPLNKKHKSSGSKRDFYIKFFGILAAITICTTSICATIIILSKSKDDKIPLSKPESIISFPETISQTPIDSLNDQERKVFEALVIAVKDFYNPQSVRVLDIKYSHIDYECEIIITGENRLGGTLQKFCSLIIEDNGNLKKGYITDLYKNADIFASNEEIDVGNINRALKQYWEDLGIE